MLTLALPLDMALAVCSALSGNSHEPYVCSAAVYVARGEEHLGANRNVTYAVDAGSGTLHKHVLRTYNIHGSALDRLYEGASSILRLREITTGARQSADKCFSPKCKRMQGLGNEQTSTRRGCYFADWGRGAVWRSRATCVTRLWCPGGPGRRSPRTRQSLDTS